MVVAGSLVSRKLPEIEEGRSMDPSTRCCFYALDGILNVLKVDGYRATPSLASWFRGVRS